MGDGDDNLYQEPSNEFHYDVANGNNDYEEPQPIYDN